MQAKEECLNKYAEIAKLQNKHIADMHKMMK